MKKIKWIILGVLLMSIFGMTFMKTPQQITGMLEEVTSGVRSFSVFVHILYLSVIIIGLLFKKSRNIVFSLFIAFISLSATIISIKYMIAPNILIFAIFFVLIVNAYLRKELNFNFKNLAPVNLLFGITGIVFGFWYLHWVESPVWLNSLLYSPIGAVNCPTMVAICGFLCLTEKPRSVILESAVSLITLYFGFFGICRLGAYVDIALILCALFLLVRLGSYLNYEGTFEKKTIKE